jgi:hypothetical protein
MDYDARPRKVVRIINVYRGAPGYHQWKQKPPRNSAQTPPELDIYKSFARQKDVEALINLLLDSGLFEIGLNKVTYEPRHIKYSTLNGRWPRPQDWSWDDPSGLLCETDSCRKANLGETVYLVPTADELASGREFAYILVSSGNRIMRFPYDQLTKNTPLTQKFRKILKFAEETLVPYAEKNYFKRFKKRGTQTVLFEKGPQFAECYNHPTVCGLPRSPDKPKPAG